MAETATKLPVNTESNKPLAGPREWRPFESLRREVDRLFEDFDRGFLHSPFLATSGWLRDLTTSTTPTADITETDKAYEVTVELPGLDEKDIEVKYADGLLTIKGEKQEEKQESKKDYYLRERRFGSFERRFQVPDGVDADKIEATVKNGVLSIALPKKPEARKAAKTIAINKAA